MIKTYRYRVKDKHAAQLVRMSRAVNVVWNWCNETQRTALQRGNRWPSTYDLNVLTAGSSVALGIPANTIQQVCAYYVKSRTGARRRLLRWRGRDSLGWVPFRAQSWKDGARFHGTVYSVWLDRPMPPKSMVLDGSSFACDSRGRWYLNLVVEVGAAAKRPVLTEVGVDLGLTTLATLSTGERIAAPRHWRASEAKLAMAQRASKKRLARTINARIGNQRANTLHHVANSIVRRFDGVYVGNVSSSRLAKTNVAKSVRDAGWSSLRRMLQYKSDYAGGTYREVNENWTTQTCSECGSLGGPKGREGLCVREWSCVRCGSVHDRDVNAARNILRLSCQAPEGARAPVRTGGTVVESER